MFRLLQITYHQSSAIFFRVNGQVSTGDDLQSCAKTNAEIGNAKMRKMKVSFWNFVMRERKKYTVPGVQVRKA